MKYVVHRCQLYKPSTSAINSLAFEPELKKLAVSRADGTIYVFDANKKLHLERVFDPVENGQAENVIWCRKRLFSVGASGFLTEWSFHSRLPIIETKLSPSPIWSCVKSRDERTLFLGTEDGAILKCKIGDEPGSPVSIENPLSRTDKRILSLAISPDDQILASGTINEIKIYDLSSSRCLNRITLNKNYNSDARRAQNNTTANKHDTLVWSLAITKNLTIVSGDSRGVTSFWDSKSGTLICEYESHKADVLTVVYDETKDQVISSGIDPTIVQFTPLTESINKNSARNFHPNAFRPIGKINAPQNRHQSNNSFVEGFRYTRICTRDVRSIIFGGESSFYLGGVDAYLVKCDFAPSGRSPYSKIDCPILDLHRIKVARDGNCIIFRYDLHTDVWKLGEKEDIIGNLNKPKQILPMKNEPRLVARIKTSESNRIIFSTIDESGDYVAYSDRKKTSVLKISRNTYTSENSINLEKLTLLAGIDQLTELPPSDFLSFINDSECLSLLLANDEEKSIFVYEISAIFVKLKHRINYPDREAYIRKIVTSDVKLNTVAILTSRNDIFVVETSTKKTTPHKLPKSASVVVDLKFVKNNAGDNDHQLLIVLYADGTMVEYDLSKNRFTPWTQQFLCSFSPESDEDNILGKCQFYGFTPIFKRKDERNLLYGSSQLVSMMKKENYAYEHDLPYSHTNNSTFKWLLHLEKMSNDDLLAVQVDPQTFDERLPPKFHFKRFGKE